MYLSACYACLIFIGYFSYDFGSIVAYFVTFGLFLLTVLIQLIIKTSDFGSRHCSGLTLVFNVLPITFLVSEMQVYEENAAKLIILAMLSLFQLSTLVIYIFLLYDTNDHFELVSKETSTDVEVARTRRFYKRFILPYLISTGLGLAVITVREAFIINGSSCNKILERLMLDSAFLHFICIVCLAIKYGKDLAKKNTVPVILITMWHLIMVVVTCLVHSLKYKPSIYGIVADVTAGIFAIVNLVLMAQVIMKTEKPDDNSQDEQPPTYNQTMLKDILESKEALTERQFKWALGNYGRVGDIRLGY